MPVLLGPSPIASRLLPAALRAARLLPLACGALLFFTSLSAASASPQPERLKCEYAVAPLGIDVATPRLSWQLKDDTRGATQTAWQVLVSSSAELLAQDKGDLWDSGRVADERTTALPYGGVPLASAQQVFWKIRAWDSQGQPTPWSAPAAWTMGLLSPADWKAQWIGAAAPSETLLLRKDFEVRPGLRRALLFVCGLGLYEAFFNGAKAGSDLLSPGWTNYRVTTLYDTRDVTALLRPGRNAAGLALGHGMYHVERRDGRFAKFVGSFGPLRAIALLRLEYEDGSVDNIATDPSWRSHPGPITFSSLYGGEDYDARLLPARWNQPEADAKGWSAAVPVTGSLETLRGTAYAAEPLGPIETRTPVSVRTLASDTVLYDFGQNASFMPRLRVTGPAGSVVRLVPGEVVKEDGSIERGTMGGAHRGSAWWQYTKATDAEETWFPQFYYLGSRYIRAELRPASPGATLPKIEQLDMVVVHSLAEPVGDFESSNPLLNRIRQLVRWAQRSNMVSVLTDCPHREKLGWIEQFHLNGPSIRYEFDVTRIYEKAMRDMAEAQTPEGLIPNIAPEYTQFKGGFRDAAEWGAAFILVPWQHYLFTGDATLMRTHYAAMQRYFAYLETQAKDDILSNGLGDWYDYLANSGKRANLTPAPITATAFFYEDARTLALIAKALGKTEDAARYDARASKIRTAYIARFRNADTGLYGTGSQASLAIPLSLGLVEEKDRPAVLTALIRDVEEKGYATAGDIGYRYLLRALADAGRSDVIYKLVNQDEKPGYGYQLKQGVTALAESWHASLGASHNHFMLGQVIEWFYADLVGIAPDPAAPGFKHIVLRPTPVPGLETAAARYASVHGSVAASWTAKNGSLSYRCEVPANTTATLWLPASAKAKVSESGRPAGESPGVVFVRQEADRAVYQLAAGSYTFTVE